MLLRAESAKSATSASTWPAEASATEAQLAVAFNLSWVSLRCLPYAVLLSAAAARNNITECGHLGVPHCTQARWCLMMDR